MTLPAEIAALFDAALAASASAIHVAPGEPTRFRVGGELVFAPSDPATPDFLPLFPAPTRAALESGTIGYAQKAVTHGGFVFAVSLLRTGGDWCGSVQLLPATVPTLAQVGGEQIAFFVELAKASRGLVLISGPVGSGKQTTAYALLQEINAHQPRRIFCVEEIPAHRLTSKTGLVSTITVGQDVPDYVSALHYLLRGADADVVYLADLSSVETAQAALSLVRLGCLVVATVDAPSATVARNTLLGGVGADALIKATLLAVTNQRLLRRVGGSGRVPAFEVLRGGEAGETLPEVIARFARHGTITETEGGAVLHDYPPP